MFTGNRGVIHDPEMKTLLRRRWTTKAWIVCACEFRGRKREVMGRNAPSGAAGWTELFFLDEVTALAAGHRPCFFCRHASAKTFADAFARGNGMGKASAPVMDTHLHAERFAATGILPALPAEGVANLPNGTMISVRGEAFALRAGRLLRWNFDGYREAPPIEALAGEPAWLITPQSTVRALSAGFPPVWHPSAGL